MLPAVTDRNGLAWTVMGYGWVEPGVWIGWFWVESPTIAEYILI